MPAGARPERLVSKAPRKPHVELLKHPKLSSPLAALARAVPQQTTPPPPGQPPRPPVGFVRDWLPKTVRDAVETGVMHLSDDGFVRAYIFLEEISGENLQALQAAGAVLELHDNHRRLVQARLPADRLEAVAALPFVTSVRLPEYAVTNTGSVTSQGDAIHNADDVRTMFGVDGTGVTVGVISDGIAGIFATGCTTCAGITGGPISTGNLPDSTGTRNASGVLTSSSGGLIAQSFRADGDLEGGLGGGVGAEGTAILEIVHDLAPGAQLRFANFNTDAEFNQAVNFLAANSDVVIDDITFLGDAYDGTSSVSSNTAAALNNNANPLRAYFTSVGNQARRHYQEPFLDSGMDGAAFTGQPGNFHLFTSPATHGTVDCLGVSPDVADVIFLFDTASFGGNFASAVILLVWNDTFGASENDYDLFLFDQAGNLVAASTDPQDGNDNPLEAIGFTNTTGNDQFFSIVVQNVNNAAAPVEFDMFILHTAGTVIFNTAACPSATRTNHNFNTVFSSVGAQSDAGGTPASVLSIGAIAASDPGNDDIELFSSNGPTNDGRLKPEASGIDGVSVTGAGGFPSTFFGTSASAPHGAGIAALLLQMAPCLRDAAPGALADPAARQTLSNLITANSIDLGVPGADNVFGFGRMDALASALPTLPTANAGPDQLVAGNTATGRNVTMNGSGSSDPTGCPLTFNWSGDCGAATGVNAVLTCPFGTNDVDLRVTNNGVTLVGPDSLTVTVTDFAVAVTPPSVTVTAGQNAVYTVNLTPLIGDYMEPVALSCANLPRGASCSFAPASATPGVFGGGGTSSTLTVSTTARPTSLALPHPAAAPLYALGFALPLAALLGRRRSPRWRRWTLLVVLLSFVVLQMACGGGGGAAPAPAPRGTPAGTHTFTITGTNGSLQHSVTATLVVN
ncbi:MAG: S8 family serine peptidase [Acidobacteria bacterium]|nr:S8 family serine peptidase [Acidobacteriota bacterium]